MLIEGMSVYIVMWAISKRMKMRCIYIILYYIIVIGYLGMVDS